MGRGSPANLTTIEPVRRGDAARDVTVLARLAALKTMSVNELKAEWMKLFGTSAPNNSRQFLELRLGYRIQELAYGGPSPGTAGCGASTTLATAGTVRNRARAPVTDSTPRQTCRASSAVAPLRE